MKKLIEQKIIQLKQKPFVDLLQLEAYQGKKVTHAGKVYTVSIWKDVVNDFELRIVVQAYRHWFLGIGKMDADGFKINSQDEVNPISKNELYEFI